MPRKVQKRPAPSKESGVDKNGQAKKKTKKTVGAKASGAHDEDPSTDGEPGPPNVGDASRETPEEDPAVDHPSDPKKRIDDDGTNEDLDTLPDVTGATNTDEEKDKKELSDIEEEGEASKAASNGNSSILSKKSVGGAGASGGKKKVFATAGGKKGA